MQLGDTEVLMRFDVALASEPVLHGCGEPLQRDVGACFEHAVCHRQGVVEDGIVGEVAHGEVVELRDWARMRRARRINTFDTEFACEHRVGLLTSGLRRRDGEHQEYYS